MTRRTSYATSPITRMLASGPTGAERWRDFCRRVLREHGVLVVRLADLGWADRELAKQLGERVYGSGGRAA